MFKPLSKENIGGIMELLVKDLNDRLLSNRLNASAFASSVFPTPVGPRNKNEPIGFVGSEEERVRREEHTLVHESVSEEEIAKIISRWTGIPVTKLTESERSNNTTE